MKHSTGKCRRPLQREEHRALLLVCPVGLPRSSRTTVVIEEQVRVIGASSVRSDCPWVARWSHFLLRCGQNDTADLSRYSAGKEMPQSTVNIRVGSEPYVWDK